MSDALRKAAIFQVAVANITPAWPQLEALFAPALAINSTHDCESIRRALMGQSCHLWIQWDGERIEAAVVSEFAHYPNGVWVRIWLAGALPEVRMDVDGFLHCILEWAEAHGCVGLEAVGRHGWLRKFPEARAEGLVMRMKI